MTATSTLTQFTWRPQPGAAAFIAGLVCEVLSDSPWAANLAARMQAETGTRFADWIDHFVLPDSAELRGELKQLGYDCKEGSVWRIESGLFPSIRLANQSLRSVFLKVESVPQFVLAHGLVGLVPMRGGPTSSIRTATVAAGRSFDVGVIERHGEGSLYLSSWYEVNADRLVRHTEAFLLRPRTFENESEGFAHTKGLIEAAVDALGVPRACDLFFAAERAYWQSRNRVARIQKLRQEALGLGWANHDHHTYRSSREHFAPMISILEYMGFTCRERFYAGKEAGWGAQVLEEPVTGVVIFADVDLSPEEVAQDFSHEPLKPRDSLGTVGLWCKLHGEAFLQAGMHHLECQFDFNAARDELKEVGVDTMKPFTDLPYLRQAFTKGEVWPVAEERIAPLLAQGLITPQQAENFRTKGAIGSHLEILQRDDGYKGFNQTGINEIIRDTDPRKLSEALGSES